MYNVCECEECRWNSLADLGSLVLAWSSDWCEFNSLGVELYTASHHNTIYIRLHGEDGEDDCIYQISTLYTLAQKDPQNMLFINVSCAQGVSDTMIIWILCDLLGSLFVFFYSSRDYNLMNLLIGPLAIHQDRIPAKFQLTTDISSVSTEHL